MADIKTYSLEQQLKEFQIDINNLTAEIEARAKAAMSLLQQQVYGKIVEKAQAELRSRRTIYLENLGMINQTDTIWVVYLKKPAGWIENGMPPHNMIPALTSGPKARVAKDGSRYNIIPFKHNKPPQAVSRAQLQIQEIVKSELKRLGLDKPVMIGDRPALGRVATLKTELTGPGMPYTKRGTPILANLTIYQRLVKTASGKERIQRDIMTFRVASTKQIGKGVWDHPGLEGAKLFEKTAPEVQEMWDQMVNDIVKTIHSGGGPFE